MEDSRVCDWYKRILAIVFLPENLLRKSNVLKNPVDTSHPAYAGCAMFLEYMETNWMEGNFSKMWNKWLTFENRTTNLAEAYHRKLSTLIKGEHPPLGDLVKVLQQIDDEANLEARRILKGEVCSSRYRKRADRERFEMIMQKMMEFDRVISTGQIITERIINDYLDQMSHHVTTKSHM